MYNSLVHADRVVGDVHQCFFWNLVGVCTEELVRGSSVGEDECKKSARVLYYYSGGLCVVCGFDLWGACT